MLCCCAKLSQTHSFLVNQLNACWIVQIRIDLWQLIFTCTNSKIATTNNWRSSYLNNCSTIWERQRNEFCEWKENIFVSRIAKKILEFNSIFVNSIISFEKMLDSLETYWLKSAGNSCGKNVLGFCSGFHFFFSLIDFIACCYCCCCLFAVCGLHFVWLCTNFQMQRPFEQQQQQKHLCLHRFNRWLAIFRHTHRKAVNKSGHSIHLERHIIF